MDPDCWFWIDPFSAKEGVKILSNRRCKKTTKAAILHPIVDVSHENQLKFLGGSNSAWVTDGGYKRYLNHVNRLKEQNKCILAPSTTLVNIHEQGEENAQNLPFLNKNLDGHDWKERFSHNTVVIGSYLGCSPSGGKHYAPNHKLLRRGINLAENKCTACCLAVMEWLGYEEVYLVGWDGKGVRWFDDDEVRKPFEPSLFPSNGAGIVPERMWSYENLTTWDKWYGELGLKITSLMTDEETIINKWVEHMTFDELFRRSRKPHKSLRELAKKKEKTNDT